MTFDTFVFKEICILPELFLGISITYFVIYGTFLSKNKNRPLMHVAALSLSVLILTMCCFLFANDNLTILDSSVFNNTIVNDFSTASSKIVVGVSATISLLMIQSYLIDHNINQFEYILLLLLGIFGLLILCIANDLITAYLAIELQSLAFYVLATFKKKSTFSVEAGLKYFILGAFSSGFFLLGTSIIYGFTGTLGFEDLKDFFFWFFTDQNSTWFFFDSTFVAQDYMLFSFLELLSDESFILLESFIAEDLWDSMLELSNHLEAYRYLMLTLLDYQFSISIGIIHLGCILLFVSLFFKLALAPFHLWSPDVYEGSPTSSTFFFAVIPKFSIFILLIRLFYSCFYCFIDDWRYFMVIISFLSIFVGCLAGLEQRKIKSLLAYSSISHMGYCMLAFSTGSFEAIHFLLAYLIIYLLSGLAIWSFLFFTRLKQKYTKKQNKDLTDFLQLKQSNKLLAILLGVVLLSIAGFPPMIGFLVKLGIFLAAIELSMFYIAVLAIVLSVISTFYYLRIIKIIFFENSLVGRLYHPITFYRSFFIVFLVFSLVFLFRYFFSSY